MKFFKGGFIRIKKFFIKNPLVLILYLFSTAFFLLQHYFDLSWDFAAYIINANYFFYGGNYIEIYRAPLISLILGVLKIFGFIGEYFYIFLILTLFLYAIINLSKTLYEKYFYKYKIEITKLNFLFYFFSLNFFLLSFGLLEGTELLGLSFFCLFLSNFLSNKTSGHYLALAFLSRYNFFIFILFLFFNRNIKKIAKNFFYFIILTLPWFIYNKIKWGNYFTSIADSFYLNLFSRLDRVEPFNVLFLIKPINWFFLFFILGLLVPIIILIRSKNKKLSFYKFEIIFAVIFLLFVYDIYSIPFKVIRYMFNLTLPIAFFSTMGAIFIIKNLKENQKKIFTVILFIGFFISLIILADNYFKINEVDIMYKEAALGINNLGLQNCQILSPHWVPVNYYSGNVRFMPYGIKEGIEKNEIILIFRGFPTIDDKFSQEEIYEYSTLKEEDTYLIFAKENITKDNCIPSIGYENPMVSDSCEILSKKFNNKFLSLSTKKICNFLN
jgi:hypothetical protein